MIFTDKFLRERFAAIKTGFKNNDPVESDVDLERAITSVMVRLEN